MRLHSAHHPGRIRGTGRRIRFFLLVGNGAFGAGQPLAQDPKGPVAPSGAGIGVGLASGHRGSTSGAGGQCVDAPTLPFGFLQYFIPTVALVALMLYGIELLKLTLFLIKSLPGPFRKILRRVAIRKAITRINSLQFVYFTKGHNIINLNKGMLYILKNEDTTGLR